MLTSADLRLGLGLLAGLLLLASPPPSTAFLAIALLPIGLTLVLLQGARGERVASAVQDALSRPANRVVLLILAAAVTAGGVVLGPFAGLILLAWLLLVLLAIAAWRGSAALAETAGGTAALAVTLIVATVALEALLNWSPIGTRLGIPREQKRWEANYDSLWTRNIFGYRTPHEQFPRRAGVSRILALGDSYTWGDKIANSDSTWPAQLELLLGRDHTEVWNLAQRGWSTANEAEMLRRAGWQLAPDVVIIQWFANDALPSGPGFAREGERWVTVMPARFRRYAAGSSATLFLVERVANQLMRARETGGGYGPLYAENAPGWQQLRSALREMGDSAQKRQVPVLLVLYPAFVPGNWTAETYPLRAIHEQVTRAAEEAGLVVLDLSGAFAREGGDWRSWWALPWDHHPSAAAHRMAATEIAKQVAPMLRDSTR